MTKEDATFYLLFGEFAVGQANAHSQILKMFLNRFETLETLIAAAVEVSQMPDGVERQQCISRLSAAVQHLPGTSASPNELRDSLAAAETYRERLEALLQRVREWKENSP